MNELTVSEAMVCDIINAMLDSGLTIQEVALCSLDMEEFGV